MINKIVYPAMFTPCGEEGYFVQVPDLDVATQGADLAEAIEMTRDAIKLTILEMEEHKIAVPKPNMVKFEVPAGSIVSYVDINMNGYREKYGNKAVKKNCTIPQWLCVMAEEQNVNFSKVLQEALMLKLGVS